MQITPMLGENLVNYSESILDGKLWRVSQKIDGVRRLFYKKSDDSVIAFSRSGHEDMWLTHIFDFLKAPWFPHERVYDCELVDRQLYFARAASFKLRTASISKANQQYPDNKKDLMALCFDLFKPGGDMRTAKERDLELYSIFNGGSYSDPMLRVPIFGNIKGADIKRLHSIMNGYLTKNDEGLMLLDMNSIYIPGRSKSLLKVKRMKEFTGRVIDVEMARPGTKIEGMVATVICEVPGCTVPVRVGSGFNNPERIHMTANSPIGREIEIEAFSYSKNRAGDISLNLPIFKRFIEG